MFGKLDFRATVFSLSIALLTTYVLCIVGDLLFGWNMYQLWIPLLPGVIWPLSTSGFLIGVVWILAYSVYFAALTVIPYNYLRRARGV